MSIHSMAIVDSTACIGQNVEIGPFCVIEPLVTIGDGNKLASRVVVKKGTTLGENNLVSEGAVLGGLPQHLNVPDSPGRLIIGSGNTIRENVTIHSAMEQDESTIVGDNNLLMVNTHIAHDCRIGNDTIFVNNSMLAGHVTVSDRAYVAGAAACHQFCRVGPLAMVGGQARIVKDVPPYVTIDGASSFVVGLNKIGLRRAGFRLEEIRQLKDAYRVIYRSGLSWTDVLARLQEDFSEGPAALYHQFLSTTTRGITLERRLPPGATLKLRNTSESNSRSESGSDERFSIHAG